MILRCPSAAWNDEGTVERAFGRERGVELSFVWRRALLPTTFLFLHFFFRVLLIPSLRAAYTWGGGPQIILTDPDLSPWHKFGVCTSSKLHSWTLSYERACLDYQKIWFKDFGFVLIFVCPKFKSLNILLAERSSSFWIQGHLQFLFRLDNFLSFTYACLVFLTCFSCWLRGGCVCVGGCCLHTSDLSVIWQWVHS